MQTRVMLASYVKRLSTHSFQGEKWSKLSYIWPARRGDKFVKNNSKLVPHTKPIHTRSSGYVITAKSANNLLSTSTAAGMGIVGSRKSTLPLDSMTCSRWSLCVRLMIRRHRLNPKMQTREKELSSLNTLVKLKTLMAKVVTAHRGDQDQKKDEVGTRRTGGEHGEVTTFQWPLFNNMMSWLCVGKVSGETR